MSQQQKTSTNINPPTKNPKKSQELLLPPNLTQKKTLVLDLDETLVHSQFGPFNIPSDVVINIEIENELHDIHVLIRPGVKEFLEKMAEIFEIVIFTASISKYAGPLLDLLDKKKFCNFRLFREHCTLLNSSFVKDLKKLGRDLKDVIIVDNSPLAYLLNSDNGLPIMTWFDDKNDRELYKITPILEFLSMVPDVRDYISKIVVNNEISYDNATKIINEYNENLRRKNNEKNLKEVNAGNISVEDNYEISDGSDNNLALINKDKNQQQININIINNNITNYIYDNKQPTKNENLSNNIINDQNKNNIGKNNFNPNSIIASVNRPEISQTSISPLTPLGKENKNKNTNSTKNISTKVNKNNNIKNGQQNKNNKLIHKKSESTGFGYKQKSKRNNLEEFINVDNNKVKPNINKNNPFIANTNYNSKSHSRKETKLKSNINNNANKNNKSAKILTNVKKEFNINKNNISVNKKIYMKDNNDKNQIKLLNDGIQTAVHNRQKILLNINNTEKICRNNNKKNNKTNTNNNLLHSVDLYKNEIAIYYHNDNFPFLKQDINNGGLTMKNRNINKFLKNNKINNKKSSSIDNKINKNFKEKNKFNYAQRINNIKTNNDFKYSKNKSKEKKIIYNSTLEEYQKIQNQKTEKIQTLNNNDALKDHSINNSAININSNNNLDVAQSTKINRHSESMKNLILDENEDNKNKKNKNPVAKRPKSSNIFKKDKILNQKKQMRRNASGRNGKNINLIKYNIIEILERRGIARSNRLKYHKGESNYDYIQSNYGNININQNVKNKNTHNIIHGKNKTTDNIIKIKTKDI